MSFLINLTLIFAVTLLLLKFYFNKAKLRKILSGYFAFNLLIILFFVNFNSGSNLAFNISALLFLAQFAAIFVLLKK